MSRNGHTTMSSTDYLDEQATDAQAAMARTLDDLKREFGQAGDPEKWVKRYPWASIGVAIVAGFAAANVVVPSGRKAERSRAEVEPEEEYAEPPRRAAAQKTRSEPSLWSKALDTLFDIAKVGVMQAVTQSLHANAAATAQPPEGSHPSEPANSAQL